MFQHRSSPKIYGRQDFASALETDDSRSARNSPHIVAISVGLVTPSLGKRGELQDRSGCQVRVACHCNVWAAQL